MLETIGKYEIRKELGRGAMGTVYEGFDPAIGRRVAIKMLRTDVFEPSQLPEVLARFKREAQSAGRLSHPHIVTIHEYGEDNGTPYIVMEFMSGTELGVYLSRGSRFPIDDIVRLMTQLLGALAVAHVAGVVHRDLKPANLFLLEDGSVKVVDFGIAHIEASNLTGTGAMLGTPAYMSPEQMLGMPVDLRSDLFSAGVILYQLLTGDRPFTGSIHTISQKILQQEPLAPSSVNPMLSAAWDSVVARVMAKKPAARFESARQFAEAIKSAFQAEHLHAVDVQSKVGSASHQEYREAEERSRVAAALRAEAEHARREVLRTEEEHAARVPTEEDDGAAAHPKAPKTVVVRQSQSRKPVYAALAVLAVLGVFSAVFYLREESNKRMAEAEVARAEQRVRLEAENKVADALRRAEEAKRENERLAMAQAEDRRRLETERTRKELEEKAKADVLRKGEDSKRKAESATKAAAQLKARKEADDKAKAEIDQTARLKADAERARREIEEKAKAEAARKVGDTKGLPACPSSYNSATWTNCFGERMNADGSKYIGEWKNGKYNGQGTQTYSSGVSAGYKYVGEFRDSNRHGQGTATFPTGQTYVGEFRNGKFNGQGTSTYSDGAKYVGEWKDDKYDGHGTYAWPDGRTYVGEFRGNRRNGQVTMTFSNGAKYV
ncbi:MAG: protein kinase domain-containing protein, partial [Betaproteobacteria bacterium]